MRSGKRVLVVCFFFFFFSSRRRHTRCSRDWSSDVCSSDLKLFVAGGTKPVYDTLVQAKIPFPHFTAYFVSAVEFFCGSLVALGFFSSFGSVALLIDMIVATLTSAVTTVPKGLSFLRWLDDFLYLPEVLYVLFFIWLICSGPGKFSVDYWLAGKLLG